MSNINFSIPITGSGGGSGTPGGFDTYVQFNDGGIFGADPDFVYNKTSNVLTVGWLTSSNLSQGSVIFAGAGGLLTGSQDHFFFDASTRRVGIGTSTSLTSVLDVSGSSSTAIPLRLRAFGANPGSLTTVSSPVGYAFARFTNSSSTSFDVGVGGVGVSVTAAQNKWYIYNSTFGNVVVTAGTDGNFLAYGNVGIGATLLGTNRLVVGGASALSGSVEPGTDLSHDLGSGSKRWNRIFSSAFSGSLTRLIDGSSYLIAGPNITINTGSNGAVQITGSAGISGTGTTNYIPKFASSTSLDDSVLQQGVGRNWIGNSTPFITSSAYGIQFEYAQVWTLIPNNTAALTINDQFRFDTSSGGQLGIGTTSVAEKLHVAISDSATYDPFIGGGPRVLRLQNTNTTNNNSAAIVNADGVGSDINSYIRFINVDHADAGIITFGTANGNSSAVRGERMRIDNLGRVGIGTSDIAAVGTDVFLFVSGSSGSLGTTDRGVAAFGGDVRISGSLLVGTGSIRITSNDIQFGGFSTRIQQSENSLVVFANAFEPGSDSIVDFGSRTKRWRQIYAGSISGSLTGSNLLTGQVVVTGDVGLLSGSNRLLWDNENSRLGIGTTPFSTLTVNGATWSNELSSNVAYVTDVYATRLSGSLTKLNDGSSYIIGSGSVSVISQSNGSIKIYVPEQSTPSGFNEGDVIFANSSGVLTGSSLLTWNNTTKKLGIGTLFPGHPLTVLGTTSTSTLLAFQISGSLTKLQDNSSYLIASGSISITTGSNGSVTIFAPAQSTVSGFRSTDLAFANSSGILTGSSRLTWNNALPNALLSVTGSISANSLSGSLTKLQDGSSYLISGPNVQIVSSSNGSITISSAQDINPGSVIYVSPSGLLTGSTSFFSVNEYGVGINTSSPNRPLEIIGSMGVSGVIWGNMYVGTFFQSQNITSQAFTGSLTQLQDGSSYLVAGPNISISTGSNGSVTISAIGVGTGGGYWSEVSQNIIYSSGSVGIGTSNTNGNRLAIAGGNLSVTGSILPGNSTTFDLGSTTYRWRDLYARSGSFSGDVTIAGDLTVNGTQFIVNTQVVEIEDNAILLNAGPSPASTGGIYVADTTTGMTGSLIWDVVTDTWKAGKLGSEVTLVSGSGVTNYVTKWNGTNSLDSSIIYDTGTNIGVGTAAVNEKLVVQGNLGLVGELRLRQAGTSYVTVANTTDTLQVGGQEVTGTSNSRVRLKGNFVELSATNVGIGTSSTTDMLAVNGQLSVTGSLLPGTDNLYDLGLSNKRWRNIYATSISGSLTGSNVTAGQIVVAGTGGVLSGSNDFVWDNANRRVGIGATSPTALLSLRDSSPTILITDSGLGTPSITFSPVDGGIGTRASLSVNFLTAEARLAAGVGGGSYFTTFYTNGSERLRISSNGNVGIGTTAMDSRLVVNGNSVLSGTLNPDSDNARDLGSSAKRWRTLFATNISGSLTGSNVTTGQVVVAGTGGVLSGSNNFFWDDTNRRVGIGTSTSLSYPLTVFNPTTTSIMYSRSGDTSGAAFFLGDSSGVLGQLYMTFYGTWLDYSTSLNFRSGYGGATRMTIDSSGRVGINTTTMTLNLEVSGSDARFHDVRIGRGAGSIVSNTAVGNGALSSNTTGVANTAIGQSAISAASISSQNTAIGFAAFQNGTGANNTAIGSNALRDSSSGNNNTAIGVGAMLPVSSTASGNVALGMEALRSHTSGNSNTALGYRAGYGAASANANTTGSDNIYVGRETVGTANNNSNEIVIGAGSTGLGSNSTVLGNASTTLTYLAGNVGIGTTSPNAYGAGYSTITVSGVGSGFLQATNTTSSVIAELGTTPDANGGYVNTRSNHPLRLGTNNTERIRIDTAGNVGIGTTSIASRLIVSGSATASTPTMVVREGVVSPTGGVGTFDVQNSAGTSLLFVTGSGNIGIGTNLPINYAGYTSLTIGRSGATGLLKMRSSYNSGNGAEFYQNTTGRVLFSADGSSGTGWYFDPTTKLFDITLGAISNYKLVTTGLVSSGTIEPSFDNIHDLGSPTKRWRNMYVANISGSLTGSGFETNSIVFVGSGGVLTGSLSTLNYNPSTGNFGINYNAPMYKLDVGGDVNARGFLYGQSSYITNTLTANALSGSLTRLSDGSSYLIAGSNISITSASNGSVTITTSGLVGGSGTTNYVPKWSSSSTLTNGIIYDSGTNIGISTNAPSSTLQLGDATVIGQDINSGYFGANFSATGVNRIKQNFAVQTMYDSAAGRITFRRAPSGNAGTSITWTTSMGIDASGNVGIGISGVYQSIASRFEVTGSGATSSTVNTHFVNSSGTSLGYIRDDGAIGFGTTTVGAAVITAQSTSALWAGLTMRNSAGTIGGYIGLDAVGSGGGSTNLSVIGVGTLTLGSGNGAKAQLDSIGNFIPTTTNSYDLGSSTFRWKDIYARSGSFTGDITINGNLTIAGTQTIINSDVVNVKDNAILLNAGPSPLSTGGIYVADTTANITGSLIWDTATDQWKAGRLGSEITLVSGSGTTNYVTKWTGANGVGSSTIYDDGTNVAIGINAANSAGLTVYAAGTPTVSLKNNITGNGSTDGLQLSVAGADSYIWNYEAGTMRFGTNASERLRIDSSGDVGIGTTAYTARVFISGSSTHSTSTLVVREGVVSALGGAKTIDAQNSSGTTVFYVSGSGEIGLGSVSSIMTSTLTTTSTSVATLMSVSSTLFRAAEFTIQGVDTVGTKYHTAKINAVHNGSASSHVEYGAINVGGITGIFDVTDPSAGTFSLQVTPSSTNSTVWKVTAILTKA